MDLQVLSAIHGPMTPGSCLLSRLHFPFQRSKPGGRGPSMHASRWLSARRVADPIGPPECKLALLISSLTKFLQGVNSHWADNE